MSTDPLTGTPTPSTTCAHPSSGASPTADSDPTVGTPSHSVTLPIGDIVAVRIGTRGVSECDADLSRDSDGTPLLWIQGAGTFRLEVPDA